MWHRSLRSDCGREKLLGQLRIHRTLRWSSSWQWTQSWPLNCTSLEEVWWANWIFLSPTFHPGQYEWEGSACGCGWERPKNKFKKSSHSIVVWATREARRWLEEGRSSSLAWIKIWVREELRTENAPLILKSEHYKPPKNIFKEKNMRMNLRSFIQILSILNYVQNVSFPPRNRPVL